MGIIEMPDISRHIATSFSYNWVDGVQHQYVQLKKSDKNEKKKNKKETNRRLKERLKVEEE